MMKNTVLGAVAILVSLGTATSVWADGGESSGGGNAVVCFDHVAIADQVRAQGGIVHDTDLEHITFIEMVDLYQAKKPRGLPPRSPKIISVNEDPNVSDGDSIREFFFKLSKRFQFVWKDLSESTRKMGEVLSDDSLRFHPNPVHQMRDADLEIELHSPACTFTTMAYNEILNDNLFYIHFDQRLFELSNKHTTHSRQSKAVLVLHEMMYLLARYMNQDSTSKKVRDFIGYMIAQNTGTSIQRFLEIADALGFMTFAKQDYYFSKNGLGIDFHPQLASFPVYTALLSASNLIYGTHGMQDPYSEYQNVFFRDSLSTEITELFARNNLAELETWSMNSAIVALEVVLYKKYGSVGGPLPAAEYQKAEKLLQRAYEHMNQRKALMIAAGEKRLEEFRAAMSEIPYLAESEKAELVKAMDELMRGVAEKSTQFVLVPANDQGTRFRGEDLYGQYNPVPNQTTAKDLMRQSAWSFASPVREVLRKTLLPIVD